MNNNWKSKNRHKFLLQYEGHYDAAEAICEELFSDKIYNPERFLEKQNWIKVTKFSGFTQGLLVEDYCITKAQYDTLVNLGYDISSEIMKFYYNYSSKRW